MRRRGGTILPAVVAALAAALLAGCAAPAAPAPSNPPAVPAAPTGRAAPPPAPTPTTAPVPVWAAGRGGFYDPPATLPGQDGALIRTQPLDVAVPGRATRVMYRSTDAQGAPTAVTGTVFVPTAPADGPRPLVSYAVGTHGLADRCAPSRRFAAGTENEVGAVEALVRRGYAVAVTDYEGLGTPGPHTYVVREAEAHAMLDMARAARRLGGGIPADGPVALAGYSQGGGASAAAAELAPDYAPDLDLVGAVAGAVPADLVAVARGLDGAPSAGLLGYAVNGLDAAYPDLDVAGLFNAQGRAALARIRDECVDQTAVRYPFARTETLTRSGRSLLAELDEEPFRSRVEQQRIGTLTPRVPVLVLHAVADEIVPFAQGRDLARRWCARGATVAFETVPGSSHTSAASSAIAPALDYLAARFAGSPAPSTCD